MDRGHVADVLAKLACRHRVPGAQLAIYREGERFELCHGVERVESPEPVSPRSRFAFGSVSKVFTAALAMQLVEEGELDLDRPIGEHLGARRIAPHHPLAAATARQLLSHTAGLVSDHAGEPLRGTSLRRHFDSVLRQEPVGAPGTAFSYSNTGYAVAAHLVEVLTGLDWWEALEGYLAAPTGLRLAFVYDARRPGARPATVSGHTVEARTGRVAPVDFHVEPTLAAAGGLAGGAGDLVDFARAFMTEDDAALAADIAAPEVLAEMARAVPAAVPFGLADGWGAGWGRYRAGDTVWLGHDGTLDGGTCNVRVHPAGRTAVALTTNATSGLAMWEDLVVELHNAGLRVGHYHQPVPSGRPPCAVERFAGAYANGDIAVRVAPDARGGLRFDVSNGFSGALTVGADLAFTVRPAAADGGDAAPGTAFTGRFLPGALQYNGRTLRRAGAAVRRAA
ncbi:serine hydrolase domain-containing protein [Marinitenerispora sediminis]|uniref:Serine hydrolase n=1 Tax=Marinitenerispora sediminis TaxID=1931232 RepID=A0A368T9J8_9ACTN|nr:serine hydrolase domain-containing protein [Marinitenerispora sediminis]RCV52790.1 serine hydrolase [Marinitenerispora sediminis]RCV59895.1 serine hydrolase [Marinitenerispora sediminis]RCV61311.1 serine hydrolase [Marinitenerispora sediminis]